MQDLNILEETVQENKHMLQKFCEGQPHSVQSLLCVCAPVAETEMFGESKSLPSDVHNIYIPLVKSSAPTQ